MSGERPVARARRENVPGGRTTRSTRVYWSAEEFAVVAGRAAALGVSVPRLLTDLALSPEPGGTAAERRAQMVELYRLTRVLCELVVQIRGCPGVDGLVAELRSAVSEVGRAIGGLAGLGVSS